MALNTDPQRAPETTPAAGGSASVRTRRQLTDEVLAEMTSWNPRERMGAFRQWLLGKLSIVHLHVLTILEAEGPLAMGRLAEALDVSVASATGIVSRMEEAGLVERRHSEQDRRIVLVSPTESGSQVFKNVQSLRQQGLRTLLDSLTEEEATSLLKGLRGLRRVRALVPAPFGTPTANTSPKDHP